MSTRRPATPPFILGIDGGATHSLGVAVDSRGRVLACARAGSLNFLGADLRIARRSLRSLVRALRAALPAGAGEVSAVIGCAALFTDATPAEQDALCGGILGGAATRLVSDAQTALFGATLGRPGVVIVAGTGSIVFAQGDGGRFALCGGWGHLLGDEGSAWWIAREAVRAALRARAGRGRAATFEAELCRYFRVEDLPGVVAAFHAPGNKRHAAGLAAFLAQGAGARDPLFAAISGRAGRELARQARAAISTAGLRRRPVPVHLVGGVLEGNRRVRAALIQALRACLPVRVVPPRLPPVLGAAALGLAGAGVSLTPDLVDRLRRGFGRG